MTTTERKPNRALELLAANVERIQSTDQWKAALEVRARFHKYSFNNCMLIAIQAPEARLVAGYRKWQEMGRQVRKGEKSIAILAPMVKKVELDDGTEERRVIGFRAASVFDVSQTDGEPLPEPEMPKLLNGDDEAAIRFRTQAEEHARTLGMTVEYVPADALDGANGTYTPSTRAIQVRDDTSPKQQLKTLIHEIAHGIMHSDPTERTSTRVTELEAETCAFVTCQTLGLDTGDYSFAYLAHWADSHEDLLKLGDRALKAAESLTAALTPAAPQRAAA